MHVTSTQQLKKKMAHANTSTALVFAVVTTFSTLAVIATALVELLANKCSTSQETLIHGLFQRE